MKLNASRIKINGIYTDEKGVFPKGRYEVPTAEEDVEFIEIKGRDGELTKKYGYKNIPFPVTFYMHADSFKTAFRKAKPFLLNAKTIQVDDDDEVFYKVKSVKINPAENTMRTFGEFEVEFTLDPYMYEINNEPITITSRTVIKNDGHKTLPIITAQVSGTGKIYVNDQEIIIQNVNGSITIDSEMKNAYRKSPTGLIAENMNKHMIGHFPVLQHGDNVVEFSGNISKLEVIPNRRWV